MNKKIHSKTFIMTIMSLFIITIIGITIVSIAGGNDSDNKPKRNSAASISPSAAPEEDIQNGTSMLAVIREIDTELFVIQLTDAGTGVTDLFTYTGGTDIRDAYDMIVSAGQLEKGEMAEVVYDAVSKRIAVLKISTEAFEYRGIRDVLFNTKDKIITFLGNRYQYDDSIMVLDRGMETSLQGFKKSDVFTVRGYGHKICSITLTRGHGYLQLVDSEKFIGGNLYVGSIWDQVAENMVLSVPEGTYDARIEFGGYEGTEQVTIERHETTSFYVGSYGPPAVEKGRVYFTIYPKGTVLYVDSVLTDYSEAVELAYGVHDLEAVLGGYRTHKGTITIDRPENYHSITLPQTPVEDPEEIDPEEIDPDDTAEGGDTDSGEEPGSFEPGAEDSGSGSGIDVHIPDSTSDVGASNEPVAVQNGNTLTIYYADGAEVYFDGTYKGEIENGSLVLPKHVGSFTIDFYVEGKEIVSYDAEIEDDGENIVLNIPYS